MLAQSAMSTTEVRVGPSLEKSSTVVTVVAAVCVHAAVRAEEVDLAAEAGLAGALPAGDGAPLAGGLEGDQDLQPMAAGGVPPAEGADPSPNAAVPSPGPSRAVWPSSDLSAAPALDRKRVGP